MNDDFREMIDDCRARHPGETTLEIARSKDGARLARAYLSRAAWIVNEIALKLARVDALKHRGARVNALSLARGSGGGASDPVGETAQALADLESETLEAYRRLTQTEREMTATIDAIGHPVYRALLHMRYIEGVKFHQIGARLGYGEKYVYKLHDQALAVAALVLLRGETRSAAARDAERDEPAAP